MAQMPFPGEEEIENFLIQLRQFRDTLPESEQRLLNAMYYAAVGAYDASDDVHSYWLTTSALPQTPIAATTTPWKAAFYSYSAAG
jgi:hypothetical protein